MFDVEKHIAFWRDGAIEDWDVGQDLVDREKTRHGLFLAHLALEKLLKAHVCRHTQDMPPRIHALLRLTDIAGLPLSDDQKVFLARFDRYQIEGRYPKMLGVPRSIGVAKEEMRQAAEVYQWLIKQL